MATARARRRVEVVGDSITIVTGSAGLVELADALALVGVPHEVIVTNLGQAAALSEWHIIVVSNWAVAMVDHAFTASGVEVVALFTVESWGTNALAEFVVEVAGKTVWVLIRDIRAVAWVSALAFACSVVESKHVAISISWAILGQA